MGPFVRLNVWMMLVLSIRYSTSGVSYNQPKFCSDATWNPTAITFASFFLTGTVPTGLFVDTNNTVYVDGTGDSRILVWFEADPNQATTISAGLNTPYSLFVTSNGAIYADNGAVNGRVDRWTLNATSRTTAMYVSGDCTGLFVDINDALYCSLGDFHQVIMKASSSNMNSSTVVAGTGVPGVASSMLRNPYGIFIDTGFNLYVADYNNDRIQLFFAGQLNGTTVVGNGASGSITLNGPSGIVLDGDGYLFIVDRLNSRIVASGADGFRCLVGCSSFLGFSFQLYQPWSLSFDSFGNLFVTDSGYARIQKFYLATNSCDSSVTTVTTSTTVHTTTTSTTVRTITTTSTTVLATTTSRTVHTTTTSTIVLPRATSIQASVFIPSSCPNQTQIGVDCNVSVIPCDILHPCQNDGTCLNVILSPDGYNCLCLSGFEGINCETDVQPCQTNTCWNDGICNQTSSTTFNCSCQPGWTGVHCETEINYCKEVRCQHNGVCRPLLFNFTCECLGTSYSGRYCEITAQQTVVHQIVSKSFAYIAILCMSSVASFIVIMDVLKYFCGIDPTERELEKIKKAKASKKVKRVSKALKFAHVNQPSSTITVKTLSPIPSIRRTTR